MELVQSEGGPKPSVLALGRMCILLSAVKQCSEDTKLLLQFFLHLFCDFYFFPPPVLSPPPEIYCWWWLKEREKRKKNPFHFCF